MKKPGQGDGRRPDDGIPTLSNDNFENEARGMECPPFVRIRYRTGRELLYDLRSWGARRRWRKGKRPHFASLVDKDGGDRDPGWPHNRVARFGAMAGLMGPRRR